MNLSPEWTSTAASVKKSATRVERKYWNVSEQTMMDLLETSAATLQA